MRGTNGGAPPRNLRAVAVAVADAVRVAGFTTATAAAEAVAVRVGGGRNVRRRLYDALKVLAAVGVVARARGTLRWRGVAHLRPGFARIARKRATAAALAARLALVERYAVETSQGPRLEFPFVLVRAPPGASVGTNEDSVQLDSFFQILNDSAIVARIAATPRALPPTTRRRVDAPPALSLELDSLDVHNEMVPIAWEMADIEQAANAFEQAEDVASAVLNDMPAPQLENEVSGEPLTIDFSQANTTAHAESVEFDLFDCNISQNIETNIHTAVVTDKDEQITVDSELQFGIDDVTVQENSDDKTEKNIGVVTPSEGDMKNHAPVDGGECAEFELDDLEWGPPLLDV